MQDERSGIQWYPAGNGVMLAHMQGLLVEYDMESYAAMGLVTKAPEGSTVRMLDSRGQQARFGGEDAAYVEVTRPAAPSSPAGGQGEGDGKAGGSSAPVVERIKRNQFGSFFQARAVAGGKPPCLPVSFLLPAATLTRLLPRPDAA